MTQDPNVIVAVDVGTTKVCTIVARREGARHFRVLSYSTVPSKGLEKGTVVDATEAQSAIRASISEAARKASATLSSAYVGITGSHVSFENRYDRIGWAASRGVITGEDLSRVPETVASASAQPGRQVIHALPRNYTLDGQSGIRDPLGMHTSRLEVESHVVSAEDSFVRSLKRAVEGAGLYVEALVLEHIASAEAVLTEDEKYEGAVLVDIGGGTSDIIVYKGGTIEYTSALPVAGFQFTNDICLTFNTTYEAAEEAKLKYGTTEPTTFKAIEDVALPINSRGRERHVALRDLSQLLRERARELIRLIRLKMTEAGIENVSETTVVLTGGSSRLPGLEGLVRRHLTTRVRVGGPDPRLDVPEALRGPEYATSVGLLRWAVRHPSDSPDGKVDSNSRSQPRDNSAGTARRSGLLKWLFPD